jgi:acyl-ACP thioesterase
MYLHKKNYEIRYTDVDFLDNLKLSALTSMLEESACLSADELEFGYSVLAPKNIGFIIANWYINLSRAIRLGETVTIHTWPIKPKRLLVFRDFEIYVGDEKVGVATSRWCMVNLVDFSMQPTSVIFANDTREYNDFRSVEFNEWKIPKIEDGTKTYEKVVSYSDYDHYNHVNNTKYADLLLDAFSPEELKNKYVSSVQITYDKQCKYGEKLEFFRQKFDDFYVVEGRVDGETRVQLKVKFDEV